MELSSNTCGKPARHGEPCNLDPGHIARGERHSNGKFKWALRGNEAKEANAHAGAPFIPPSTKKAPRCQSAYGTAGQCQLFAKHQGDHFTCVPDSNPFGFSVQTWTDAGDAKSWAVCGVRKELRYNGDSAKPVPIRDKRDRILCLRPGKHAGEHIGLDNVGNHTCEWKDGSPASVHSPKSRIDFVAELLGTGRGQIFDDEDDELEIEPAPAEAAPATASESLATFAQTVVGAIKQTLAKHVVDLCRVGDEGTWCVVTKREKGPKSEPNFVLTACGDKVHVTTAGFEGVYEAALTDAPASGLPTVVRCPVKTNRGITLTDASVCPSCAVEISPPTETNTEEPALFAAAKPSTPRTRDAKETRSMDIDMIRHDRIEADPNQPRKTFDQAKLQELADSITAHGIETPISVRPKPGKAGYYILNWGERRWRAAELAGLDTLPAIVDEDAGADPAKLLERQLIENAQREDIHPLEEGEALNSLHTTHGYAIDELMAKVGKSRSHVYARIQLTKLAPGVKKAMLDGRLPTAHATLIGTIPDPKAQEQCCKEVLGEVNHEVLRAIEEVGLRHEAVNEKDERAVWQGDSKKQALSFRATSQLIRRRYQTRLALATFDPTDATLTPAGACGTCPHNSGNQPELPGIASPAKADSYCGNLPCFEKKTLAQFKRIADDARADGKAVIEGKKAAEVFGYDGAPKQESGYALPTQRLPYNVTGSYDDKLTYKKLLGKHITTVPKVIVQDGRGAAVEVLDAEKAHEILREHKLLPKKGAGASGIRHGAQTEAEKKAAAKRKKEREAEKLREEAFPFLIAQAVSAARSLPAAKMSALWRMLALFIREHLDFAAGESYRGVHGDEEPHDHIGDRAERLKTEPELRGLVVELLLFASVDDITSGAGITDEAMLLATKLFALDWDAAEREAIKVREARKETEAAEKKADAAKAKKKGGGK